MKMKWMALALSGCCAVSASALELTVKDSDVRLQLYGYVKADAVYESQGTMPKTDLAFWVLPEVAGEKDAQLRFGARESRLGVNLLGPDAGAWKTMGKLEIDFYGGGTANAYTPRIRLAFVDMAHSSGLALRLGQDWETFIEVVPRTVNFATLSDAGALGLRRTQGRATQEIKLSENTKIVLKAAVAQTIGEDLDGGGYDDGADADYPSVQFNAALHQKLWAEKPARIAFSGHFGTETLDSSVSNAVVAADAKDYDTWSMQGSIFLPLTKCLSAQGNVWSGENLDTYYGAIGQGVNMTLGKEIAAVGGWAQLIWDANAKFSLALGYGVDDPDDEDLNVGNRSKNEQVFANAFYKVNAAVTAMAEYAFMTTDYLEKADATSDRVQLAVKYTF